ncbi:hypothetical protein DSO57_1019019 [Entomophthora muscae]|uniref:Uncharacterized protein n=1 Tax=Entomophthora muscae TaxID=34485 RepID=A0ACC2TRH2_9FUNG|nr:hypothetical protein DSO57_1019019 [Entomophthora muscae]
MDLDGGEHDLMQHFDLLPCIEILQSKFQRTYAHGGFSPGQIPYWFTLDGLLYYMDIDEDGKAKIHLPMIDLEKGTPQCRFSSANLLPGGQNASASSPGSSRSSTRPTPEYRTTSEVSPTVVRSEIPVSSQSVHYGIPQHMAPSFIPLNSYQIPRSYPPCPIPYHGLQLYNRNMPPSFPLQTNRIGTITSHPIEGSSNLVHSLNAAPQPSRADSNQPRVPNYPAPQKLRPDAEPTLSFASLLEEVQNVEAALDDMCERFLNEADFSEAVEDSYPTKAPAISTPVSEDNRQPQTGFAVAPNLKSNNSPDRGFDIKKEPSPVVLDCGSKLTNIQETEPNISSNLLLNPAEASTEEHLVPPQGITPCACQDFPEAQSNVESIYSPLLESETTSANPFYSVASDKPSHTISHTISSIGSTTEQNHAGIVSCPDSLCDQSILDNCSRIASQSASASPGARPDDQMEASSIDKEPITSSELLHKPSEVPTKEAAISSPHDVLSVACQAFSEIQPKVDLSTPLVPENIPEDSSLVASPVASNKVDPCISPVETTSEENQNDAAVDPVSLWRQKLLLKTLQASSPSASIASHDDQIEPSGINEGSNEISDLLCKPTEESSKSHQGIMPTACQSSPEIQPDVEKSSPSPELAHETIHGNSTEISLSMSSSLSVPSTNNSIAAKRFKKRIARPGKLKDKLELNSAQKASNSQDTLSNNQRITSQKQSLAETGTPAEQTRPDQANMCQEAAVVTSSVKKQVTFGKNTIHIISSYPDLSPDRDFQASFSSSQPNSWNNEHLKSAFKSKPGSSSSNAWSNRHPQPDFLSKPGSSKLSVKENRYLKSAFRSKPGSSSSELNVTENRHTEPILQPRPGFSSSKPNVTGNQYSESTSQSKPGSNSSKLSVTENRYSELNSQSRPGFSSSKLSVTENRYSELNSQSRPRSSSSKLSVTENRYSESASQSRPRSSSSKLSVTENRYSESASQSRPRSSSSKLSVTENRYSESASRSRPGYSSSKLSVIEDRYSESTSQSRPGSSSKRGTIDSHHPETVSESLPSFNERNSTHNVAPQKHHLSSSDKGSKVSQMPVIQKLIGTHKFIPSAPRSSFYKHKPLTSRFQTSTFNHTTVRAKPKTYAEFKKATEESRQKARNARPLHQNKSTSGIPSRIQNNSSNNPINHGDYVSTHYSNSNNSFNTKAIKRVVSGMSHDFHNADCSDSLPLKKPMPERSIVNTSSDSHFNTLTLSYPCTAPERQDIFDIPVEYASSSPLSQSNDSSIQQPIQSSGNYFTFTENIEESDD